MKAIECIHIGIILGIMEKKMESIEYSNIGIILGILEKKNGKYYLVVSQNKGTPIWTPKYYNP